MVEFALVLPLLALILFGVIQLGTALNDYLELTDAVRTGARTAAVSRHEDDPAATTIAKVRAAAGGLDQVKLGVTVSSPWEHGTDVVVSATYPYEISLLGLVVRAGSLTSSTRERVE